MRCLTLILLLLSPLAMATGKKPPASVMEQNQGQAQGQLQGQKQGQHQTATAEQQQRQEINSYPTIFSNPSQKQLNENVNAPVTQQTVQVNEAEQPDDIRFRNNYAPDLGAPGLTAMCWVGNSVSGGAGWGAFGAIFTRRDPLCMAEHSFVQLVKLRLPGPAAQAYCQPYRTGLFWRKRDGLWLPFGSPATCVADVKNAVAAMLRSEQPTITINIDQANQNCAAAGAETVIREVQDDGLTYVYKCTEREVIGKGS